MAVVNWCYGAYAPTENSELVDEQYWLAHRYKNKLIELERERRVAATSLAMRLHPPFCEAQQAWVLADQAVDAAYATLNAARAKARARVAPTAAQQKAINAAKQARKRASENLKPHKAAAYKLLRAVQAPYLEEAEATADVPDNASAMKRRQIVRERHSELLVAADLSSGEGEYLAAHKAARAECGLYWGTYTEIEEAAKDYRKGAPPKFRRWSRNGTISVQLQGGLSVDEAIACESRKLRMFLPDMTERMAVSGSDRGLQARGEAWLRVGSNPDRSPIWAVAPFVLHRPLPDGAIIKRAYLDRRQCGSDTHYALRLTLNTDRPQPSAPDSVVAVHMGYRQLDHGLRVATWLGSDGESGEIVLPSSQVESFGLPHELQSIRDQCLNTVLPDLARWAANTDSSDWFREQTETLAHWRGPDRLSRLVTLWRENRFAADTECPKRHFPDLLAWVRPKLAEYRRKTHYRPRHPDDLSTVFGLLDFWRRFDRHLADWAANQRRKGAAMRDQMYRKFAKRMRERYGTVIIAKINWADLAITEEADEDVVVTTPIRRRARVGSPGKLSAYLAERFAGSVLSVSATHITSDCCVCGHRNEWDRLQLRHTCDGCGADSDQDENAVKNTLASGLAAKQKKEENADETDDVSTSSATARKTRRNRRADQ